MNSIRWAVSARKDMRELLSYHEQRQAADAGRMLIGKIIDSTKIIETFPQAGRQSILKGVRELVMPHIPYFLVYQFSPGQIEILRVMHTSKLWNGIIK